MGEPDGHEPTEGSRAEAAQESDERLNRLTDPVRVEGRIIRNIIAVVALAIVAAALFADLKFMLGLTLGGALAVLNYKWLHSSLRAILESGTSTTPPGTRMQFIVRWLIIGLVVYFAYQTGYFEALAMLMGLLAPALAVMIEAVYVTYKTL